MANPDLGYREKILAGMTEEQRIEYMAAVNGTIPGAQYSDCIPATIVEGECTQRQAMSLDYYDGVPDDR